MTSLVEAYHGARTTVSDIHEHVPTLRRLAEQCTSVTEFGVRTGVSTIALLAGSINGKLKRLHSFDKTSIGADKRLKKLCPEVFTFILGSTLNRVIAPTDFLFIDTLHTYDQLKRELTLNHNQVHRWIAMHDTNIFGHRDEGKKGEGKGLLPAVKDFLKQHPEWFVSEHYTYNHGLTILSKDQRDNYGACHAPF